MRIITMISVSLILSSCMITGAGMRTITSLPSDALVTIEGYGQCTTPCTVKLDDTRNVTVAKAGYNAQRFSISPSGGDVQVEMQLAAPAGDVDAEALPSLD